MRKAKKKVVPVKTRIMRLIRRNPRTCAAVAKNLGVTPAYAWQYLNRYTRELALVKYTDMKGDVVYAVPTEPVLGAGSHEELCDTENACDSGACDGDCSP